MVNRFFNFIVFSSLVVGLLILLCCGATYECRPLVANQPKQGTCQGKKSPLSVKMKFSAAQLMLAPPPGCAAFARHLREKVYEDSQRHAGNNARQRLFRALSKARLVSPPI
jgi:hypothetical protein